MARIGFSPPATSSIRSSPSVVEGEALLARWFGRPVVLTSSGRAALLLALRHVGLNRYRSRVAISPRTAQCVFDAVTRAAFPIDPATDASETQATILIHQYGFIQSSPPQGPVIEDICHSFFATPTSGERDWRGPLAVFSLPKFFGMAGMCGGLVAENEAMAGELRKQRDAAPALPDAILDRDRRDWLLGSAGGIEEIYLRALLHPACHPAALAGLPTTIAALWALGEQRAATTRRIIDNLPETWLGGDWRTMCLGSLPYALPVFADADSANRLSAALAEPGFETGVFQVDRNRNMYDPSWDPAVLLPCHQALAGSSLDLLIDALVRLRPRIGDSQ